MPKKQRFLVLTLDAAGNWPPELALIRGLVERGHDVRVMSHDVHTDQIREAGATFRPYGSGLQREPTVRRSMTPEEQVARVRRDVLLNRRYGDALLAEVERDPPDRLLVDFMLLMAAVAAESTRLPTAILWHTVFGGMAARLTLMSGALLGPLNELRGSFGLDQVADLRGVVSQAGAILVFTEETFDIPLDRPMTGLHYVGPLASLPAPTAPYRSPWDAADPRALIVASYSTGFQDQASALQRVADAAEHLSVRVLLTLGRAIAADELRLPANVVAVPFVPHASVMPFARLVVTHAGHGTVMAALTAGVPVVCTPMGRDQPDVAACVERLRLGVVLPNTATATDLRGAIVAALTDDALRERVRAFAVGADLEAGLARAIEVLEHLDVTGPVASRRAGS